jgi:hypothetical protein
MTVAEEYRRNAHQCREQAGKSVQIGDKAIWLKLAEDWQRLAEQLDAGSAHLGTVPIEANGVVVPVIAWTGNDELKAEQGFEPPQPGKTEQRSDSYGAIVDRFIELYAKPRQRSWHDTERVLKAWCKPWLDRPINEITKKDAYDLLDAYVTEGKHVKAATCVINGANESLPAGLRQTAVCERSAPDGPLTRVERKSAGPSNTSTTNTSTLTRRGSGAALGANRTARCGRDVGRHRPDLRREQQCDQSIVVP